MQNTTAPHAVDIDGFRAMMRDAGAEDAVDMILGTFVFDAAERRAALASAIASGIAHDIETAAHAFKSAAGSVCARDLAAALLAIELAAKDGDITASRALTDTALQETDAAITEVHAYLDGVFAHA